MEKPLSKKLTLCQEVDQKYLFYNASCVGHIRGKYIATSNTSKTTEDIGVNREHR